MWRTVLVLLALTACIPKARYDEQVATNAQLTEELARVELRADELRRTRARLENDLANANAALEEANRRLATALAEAGSLQEDIEEMRQALQALELSKARAEASLQAFRDLVSRFQSMIDAGTLRVRVIDGRMVVELATDILFPSGSASLSREGQQTIQEVAAVLASISDREFQVAGHTDNVPIATARFPSNWDLGAARAISVTRLLIEGGLPPDRVSAASYAEFRPVDTNRTQDGRAHNRRIEIVVVPDLSDMPGYDELERLGTADGE